MPLDLAGRGGLFVESAQVTKEFVVDIEQGAPASSEVSTPLEAERISTSSAIERLGSGSAPVNDDCVLLAVPYADTANVKRVVVFTVMIDATKNERSIANVELLESVENVLRKGISLESCLVCAAFSDLQIFR